MAKRMIIMLVLCGLVAGGVIGFKSFGHKMMMNAMAQMGSQPQTVSTMKAVLDSWQPDMKVVGTLKAVRGADLAAEASGTVENIFVESGQDVTEGTVILQMRSAEDIAQLQALQAQAKLAELTVERNEKQIKAQAISQAAYDADKANFESLKAQVAQQEAAIQKKTVLAPFAGRLGIRKVEIGQYVSAGTPVVTLQQMDALHLDFFVPQQNLPRVQVGQKVMLRTDTYAERTFEGEIVAVNPKVDEATRNVEVRALFPNPEKLLRPGMFAAATITTGDPTNYITLPQTAVTFNPYGNTVFMVKTEGTDDKGQPKLIAKTSFVKTGPTRCDQIAVLEGVSEGDEVVTAGQMKLRNGTAVIVNNVVQPTNDPAPKPVDR